ncbi:MAG: hypothetical protein U0Y68_10365 [Blastocatellia bacterium]
MQFAHEGEKDWLKSFAPPTGERKFPDGWGAARIDLSGAKNWKVMVTDLVKSPLPPLAIAKSKFEMVNLPDSDFRTSLQAQTAHLLAGLDGLNVWPGDPTSYTKRQGRAGAQVIVALARVGQLEVARSLLLKYLADAEPGPLNVMELEAPGWALWAAEEVAARVNRTDCDKDLWQHVALQAQRIVKAPLTAPPAALAINYRGLLCAATLAERYRMPDEAKSWRVRAEELKAQWKKAPPSQLDIFNPAYGVSLWPSWVAAESKDSFQADLQKRWQLLRDAQGNFLQSSAHTALELADAHQWLLLDKPDRTWQTLRGFWANQAIAGLYTWGDAVTKEHNLSKWEQVRAITPQQLSPLYNTAAELLLLQLDMLGYYNEATQELIIGAGATPVWANLPLDINNLSTGLGEISWHWDAPKKQLTVIVPDKRIKEQLGKNKVRLGINFPAKAKVVIEVLKTSQ